MAGGGGTRLWPLSTDARPKQFLSLLSDRSLLRETFERVQPAAGDVFVATAERYVDLVRHELPEVPEGRILTEPARRNSGPALLCAALALAEESDAVTAAIPSDQTAADAEGFRRTLGAAAALAERASVVVLAVPPTRPETDFGYLELSSRAPATARRSSTSSRSRGRRRPRSSFAPAVSGTPASSSSALRASSPRRGAWRPIS